MDQSNRLKFLFDKYLHRLCSPEEVDELIALLQREHAPDSLGWRLKELWEAIRTEHVSYPVDWDKMYQTVLRSGDGIPTVRNSNPKARLRIAAIILVLFTGTALYLYLNKHPADNRKRLPAAANALTPEKTEAANKRQTIHLPDGSTVVLNADSRLDYPSAFTGKTREIYLSGEAYFDIKHNPQKPFLVHTGKITTKVLGTSFDIRAYPEDESIKVTVTRGKVQVLKENKSLGLITANQQISFSKKTEAYAEKVVDSKSFISWKPEEISFNDISMLDAAKKIEQRFGKTVEFANPDIKNCRVTATFSEDDVLEEILIVICGVSKSNFVIQNNKVIINGKGCKE
ncbi:MAG: FecR family protein [Chitinophagales bacterium]